MKATQFIAGCFIITLLISSCNTKNPDKEKRLDTVTNLISLPSGLQYRILQDGHGKVAMEGDTVLIYEAVRYRDSTILFSNEGSGNPIRVLIGGNQATEGEDEGIRGMKTGEIREMIIPPALSKRQSYPPNLSPDSTIVVKVILEKILASY